MSLFDGLRNLFSHNDHCEIHTAFQSDCEACRLTRQRRQTSIDTSPTLYTDTLTSPVDTSTFDINPDTGSIDTGNSDFGGFDGGDSGGGGASGDF